MITSTVLRPMAHNEIEPPLVLYKKLQAGSIARLQVPPDALTAFDHSNDMYYGPRRSVRASKVEVITISDAYKEPLSAARALIQSSVIYEVGCTLDDSERWYKEPLPGTNQPGFYGFTTLLEAALFGWVPTDLSAYGLLDTLERLRMDVPWGVKTTYA